MSILGIDYESVRYTVDWQEDRSWSNCAERGFDTRREAEAWFNELSRRKYHCVFIAEQGTYLDHGVPRTAFFYYRATPNNPYYSDDLVKALKSGHGVLWFNDHESEKGGEYFAFDYKPLGDAP